MLSVHYNIIKSLLLVMINHGNELHQIHLITGAPHGVNPSLINCSVCVYTWGGFTHFVMTVSMHMLGNPWSFFMYMGMNYI